MRLVLDTDPGIDDALAILFLAAQDQVEIVAVGSVHGNVPAEQAADNALRVLELVGLDAVPVAIGARRPLAQSLHTSEFVHGPDGLGGHAGAAPRGRPIEGSAAEQLVRLVREHPGELTVLALGPLTNIALALLLEPELPRLLRSVVVMGGALTAPGNITPSADANSWHDPEAADLVLGAGLPLTLIGLEVTETARANAAWLDELAAIDTPRARFATKITRHYTDFYTAMFGQRECTLHDPLAAAITVDPGLATYRRLAVAVELTGTHTRGRLIADLRPIVNTAHIESSISTDRHPVDVALSADAGVFLARLLESLG